LTAQITLGFKIQSHSSKKSLQMQEPFVNDSLKPIEKVVIFAFVSMIVGLPQEIRKLMMANLGFGDIKLIRIYIFILTFLYIIHLNYFRRMFKAPHLTAFLLLFSVFFVFEKYLFHLGDPDISFILTYLQIYLSFLMLANLGRSKLMFYKIIDYAFYSTLIFCLLYWIGFLGLIKVQYSDLEILEVLYEKRSETLTYQNFISYLCAFSILLIIIRRLSNRNISLKNSLKDILYLFLFNGLIVFQGTRGAAALAMVLTAYYTSVVLQNKGAIQAKVNHLLSILLIMIVLVLAVSAISLIDPKLSRTHFYQRIQTLEGVDFRIENMANAFANFVEHPFTGVGYDNAAKRGLHGTRSNNEYMQILAGSGIIVFTIYLFCIFRLIVFRFRLLKRPEVALCAFYFAFLLLFERPFDMVAIIAYITFYFSHEKGIIDEGVVQVGQRKR